MGAAVKASSREKFRILKILVLILLQIDMENPIADTNQLQTIMG